MRICIFGAGAVGSHLAVRLARAGNEVSCVMRGPHLAAVRQLLCNRSTSSAVVKYCCIEQT